MNLVGWTQAASKPQFPKDDSNVSPQGMPKDKGHNLLVTAEVVNIGITTVSTLAKKISMS